MMKNILYSLVVLLLILTTSSCGENGSTSTQTNLTSSVTIVADKTQAIADGIDGASLTVTVNDSTGTPIANKQVNFNITAEYYTYLSHKVTDENGQVTIFVKQIVTRNFFRRIVGPTTTTLINVIASVDGVSSNTLGITYVPLSSAIIASVELVADKTQAIANGTDVVTFTAAVKDVNGLVMPNYYINFNVSPGANIYMSPGYTDANGNAVIRLTCPPKAQQAITTINVTASSNSVTSNIESVSYSNPPQVSPAVVTLTSDKTSMIADGTDRITFTITAYDSNSLTIAGQAYHLDLPPGPYSAATNILTNSSGQGLSALIYNRLALPALTIPTTIIITATINGTTSNAINITLTPP